MASRDYLDLGQIFDQIFKATEELSNSFSDFGFNMGKYNDTRNYYAMYPFPPANIYMISDRSIVFEFALAGYRDADIALQFNGEYMILSATAPAQVCSDEEVIFFNRRLKFTDIPEQKYFVPEDKFDREQAKAVFKNGILKVTVPSRDEVQKPDGVRITIVSEDEDTSS